MALSPFEMERMAVQFRKDLGLSSDQKLDPLKIKIEGVRVITIEDVKGLSKPASEHLKGAGSRQWSAMSVPIDVHNNRWVIVRNHLHDEERQRVSVLEEFWHILLGHELTKIVKVGSEFGRSFESDEEHDAYYLAAATLAPKAAIKKFVEERGEVESFAGQFGISRQLAEFRIKRLGLWRHYKPKSVVYNPQV